MFLELLRAFLVGGLLCCAAQILIDRTRLTPARILTLYVIAGVVLGAIGVYPPLVDFAGAGATVPLLGFGNTIAMGMQEAIQQHGILGIFSGSFTAASAGIGAAVLFGWLISLVCKSKEK